MKNDYIDFHCHPSIKPYGKSFNRRKAGQNSKKPGRTRSIWHRNRPSVFDKLLQYIFKATKFNQASMSNLAIGGVKIACVSLYPLEKGFFNNDLKPEAIKDLASNFATGVGRKRVDFIQGISDYYQDLEKNRAYYEQLDGKLIQLSEGKYRYKLVSSIDEIHQHDTEDEENGINSINIIFSIEGMHVLNSDCNAPVPDENKMMDNLNKIKNWPQAPFFVTVAHHFWNHLCGHAKSFGEPVDCFVKQEKGMNEGMYPLGEKVIREMLNREKGRRILVDIKHMSVKSRYAYYEMIREMDEDIPIIVSHGAANGMVSQDNRVPGSARTASKMQPGDINFFDEEIILIAQSKGIFGLQLDERRVVNKETLKKTKHSVKRAKIMHYRSELLWFQIQYIAETLDNAGEYAWDCMVLGSDYDGIIDPINGFWTAEELPYLADFLERHAYNYLKDHSFKTEANQHITADELIDRIMSKNGNTFLEKYFTKAYLEG